MRWVWLCLLVMLPGSAAAQAPARGATSAADPPPAHVPPADPADPAPAPGPQVDVDPQPAPDAFVGWVSHTGGGERGRDRSRQWMVRGVLAPTTLLFAVLAAFGAWRARRVRGLALAAGLSLALGLLAIAPVLPAPGQRLMMEDDDFTDPINSAELIVAIGQSLPRLSDVTTRWSYPEGATWIVLGPSWLGYLGPALIAPLGNPLTAHNLGVAMALALLGLCAWGVARELGAGPLPALAAAGGAVLAPVILRELDNLSLDRGTLPLVPLFLLCLHRAAERPGWRWPVFAGVALAAAFYGQTYYGLYLAAAFPLLALTRLLGPSPLRRLGRLALAGGVGLALLLPGALVLRAATADTPYQDDERRLADVVDDLRHPVATVDANTFVDQHRRSLTPPMGSPRERLMSAMAFSIPIDIALSPSEHLLGHAGFWVLTGLALLLARRRRLAAVAAADVAVLLLFALGPFFSTRDGGVTDTPLPYYAYFLAVPGFEQLKIVNRFVLLAATVSTVPLALGIEGLASRLPWRDRRGWPWLEGAAVLALVALLATVRVAGFKYRAGEWQVFYPRAESNDLVAFDVGWPGVRAFPPREALRGLEPGPAFALPYTDPTPVAVTVAAMQARWPLVNPPGFGTPRRLAHSYWCEDNAFLNQLTWTSGSDRPNRYLALADPGASLGALDAAGLRYVVMFRDQMPTETIVTRVEAFVDGHLGRVADDGEVVVWSVAGAGEAR